MATSKSAWTRAESSLAAIFGARRRVLSGSANRPDLDGDDSTHERLFLESKLRASWSVWSLWRAVDKAAGRAKKIPVLGLREKGRHGALLVIHEDDLRAVVAEFLAARDDADILGIEAEVRVKRLGLGGDV